MTDSTPTNLKRQERGGKRKELQQKRRAEQRRRRLITISAVVLGAIALVALVTVPSILRSIQQANAPVGNIVEITPRAVPQAKANAMGDPNAPVKIDEYSDFQCPYCKNFADETEAKIVEAYVATGKVYMVYHVMGNWVSQNAGKNGTESQDSGLAAYCAGDQNKFWEYKQYLFANWTGEEVGDFTPKRLAAFAEKLSLDMNAFNSCYSSGKFKTEVQQGYADGLKAGINGTPAFMINGKLVVGALPFDDPTQKQDFKREIEAALAAAGAK